MITPYADLKQKRQLGEKEMQNIQFEEKKSPQKFNIGLKSYVQRDEKLNRLRHQNFAVQWNAGSGTLRVGPTQLSLQLVKSKAWRMKATTTNKSNLMCVILGGGRSQFHQAARLDSYDQ